MSTEKSGFENGEKSLRSTRERFERPHGASFAEPSTPPRPDRHRATAHPFPGERTAPDGEHGDPESIDNTIDIPGTRATLEYGGS